MTTVELSSFQCIEMAIFNTAALAGTFAGLNLAASYAIYTGNGFSDDIKLLKYYNDGTTGIIISYDGIKQDDFLPSKATLILDLQANHADNSAYSSGRLNGRKGQIVYGKGTAGVGNLYISGYR